MATVPLTSPDTDNYQVGKGIVSFKPEGENDYIDLGNVTVFEYTPTIEKLDHFSSRAGIKTKDKSVVVSRGGSLKMTMEEITGRNLSMLLMGTFDEGAHTVSIFTADTVQGSLKFVATNEVGPKWDFEFYNVEFSPSGSFNPISDGWNSIEVTGEVLSADGGPNDGLVGLATLTNADDES